MNKFCRGKADGDVRKRSMFVGIDAHKTIYRSSFWTRRERYWTVQEQTIT